ncbi:MAG: ABC transporter ATP-binding protein [Chlorobi bacterium]|nr:ABC transporter ATP-binding protein [Chlorobiota bacterium]
MTMLAVSGIEKSYGRYRVLAGVNLRLDAGEVVALMGPNGSGKSTLIKCIVGLVRPDRGTISLMGNNVFAGNGIEARRAIGYMPQIARYPETMTVGELFDLIERIRSDCRIYDRELYDALRVDALRDKQLGSLSGGQRQRVSAALAFYFSPMLLLLDEPTAGLDPISTEAIKAKIIREKTLGKTILITTHGPQDALELADRLVYLFDGLVRIDRPIATLISESSAQSLMGAIAWYLQHNGVQ